MLVGRFRRCRGEDDDCAVDRRAEIEEPSDCDRGQGSVGVDVFGGRQGFGPRGGRDVDGGYIVCPGCKRLIMVLVDVYIQTITIHTMATTKIIIRALHNKHKK